MSAFGVQESLMNLDRVIFTWGVGSYGWGVVGINFMLHWPGQALTCALAPWAELPQGDPRAQLLADRIQQCKEWWDRYRRAPTSDCPVFVGLGNGFQGVSSVRGAPSVAFPVFEDVESARTNAQRLHEYPLVITASRWNHDVLAEIGIKSCMVHQGYDPVLFHPGVRRKATDGRFHVWSGGKAEYRKGQDLVLEGFKIFADRHDDAVLHAGWSSPWPGLARTFEGTRLGAPPGADIGMPNFAAWAQKAGIKPHQFEAVPPTPNHLMPGVLAPMDCAVFASRAEGGTNISAMECMGCGIPTILSPGTGHSDLHAAWGLYENSAENIAMGLDESYRGLMPETAIASHRDNFAWPARIAELVGVLRDV
jgi:glycosyltransferase involved in cell wall biosynthesis